MSLSSRRNAPFALISVVDKKYMLFSLKNLFSAIITNKKWQIPRTWRRSFLCMMINRRCDAMLREAALGAISGASLHVEQLLRELCRKWMARQSPKRTHQNFRLQYVLSKLGDDEQHSQCSVLVSVWFRLLDGMIPWFIRWGILRADVKVYLYANGYILYLYSIQHCLHDDTTDHSGRHCKRTRQFCKRWNVVLHAV